MKSKLRLIFPLAASSKDQIVSSLDSLFLFYVIEINLYDHYACCTELFSGDLAL